MVKVQLKLPTGISEGAVIGQVRKIDPRIGQEFHFRGRQVSNQLDLTSDKLAMVQDILKDTGLEIITQNGGYRRKHRKTGRKSRKSRNRKSRRN